jgi:2,4-dienoyl-CoA reductase (NADPH2)
MEDILFTPIQINQLELKNRIFLPAMHLSLARDFLVTDSLIEFYAVRAKGGAAAIVVGFATIDELSGDQTNIGAHKDEYIPGLKNLADAIKDNGSRAILQINHAGKNNHSMMLGGKSPVAPSAVPNRLTRETPRALEKDEIPEIIAGFARAAVRCQKAGYDAVEVLSGSGYLISSFLSPITNIREDEWGGTFENRMRFGIEVMKAIKQAVGKDYPMLARINGNDLMPGGVGRKDLQIFAKELEAAGVDALNINVGWHEARIPQIVTSVPKGVYGYLSKGIKEQVNIPVITSHRVNTTALAREMLADGMCDLVAMARPLIADPFLPEKSRQGREKEIVHCIACAQGCFDHLVTGQGIACLCNPKAGHEKETIVEKAETQKKVMVIGGGPAGMSAALAAAERGHEVTVYDKGDKPGGQLYLAAAPPGREEFSNLARDLGNQLVVNGVKLQLNTEVNAALIDQEKPDHILLATGASPLTLPIPGSDLPHVVQAWDVLLNKAMTGKRVVIIGGGAVGVETALFLAEKGTLSGDSLKFLLLNKVETPDDLYELATKGSKEVILLEMIDRLGKDIGRTTRWTMMQDISRYGVETKTGAKALEINQTGVKIEIDGSVEEIAADTVVLAAGARPENSLQAVLETKEIPHEVIGDAKEIAHAYDAVHGGFAVGRTV